MTPERIQYLEIELADWGQLSFGETRELFRALAEANKLAELRHQIIERLVNERLGVKP